MNLKPFSASPSHVSVEVQDGPDDAHSQKLGETLRFTAPDTHPRGGWDAKEIEARGVVRATGDDGELLVSLSYPDARAAAEFIETMEPGEREFDSLKVVREPGSLEVTVVPMGASIRRRTVLNASKAMLVAAALRFSASHHRFPDSF